MPHASEMSIGATLPRKSEARNDETSEIREVALYTSGRNLWNLMICGPVKRCVH